MAKKVRRSPKTRKAQIHAKRQPQDVGLRTGEEIQFTAKFPDHGSAISRRGDGGFRLTLDVPEEETKAMHQMWKLMQTAFELYVLPPNGGEVAFIASFPTHGGAINRHGDGGCRLTFDVAEEEMGPMARLMPMIQKELKISVFPRLGALPSKEAKDGAEAAAPAVVAQD